MAKFNGKKKLGKRGDNEAKREADFYKSAMRAGVIRDWNDQYSYRECRADEFFENEELDAAE